MAARLVSLLLLAILPIARTSKPHIVFILADDMVSSKSKGKGKVVPVIFN
jgi:hypothetical protein